MARRLKTVEYAFETLLTSLATSVSIGSSATHTFVNQDGTDLTLYIPETNGRQFHSVCVEICWRDVTSTVETVDYFRIGIKLGAVATDNIDFSQASLASTSDHDTGILIRDVTEYFNTNFGTTGSNTCQVTFAAAGATATIINISCKLLITYSYDDSYAPTLLKTVRIPVQSFYNFSLPDSTFREIGNDTDGVNSNGCAAQYPALDTFLPESDKVYRQVFIEILGNDNPTTSTTDYSSSLAIRNFAGNSTITGSSRCLIEQGGNTATYFKDIWQINTGTVPTNVGYRLMFAAGLLQRFQVGAIINVTYEYTGSSQTVMNSVIIPASVPGGNPPNHYKDSETITFPLYVPEPRPSQPGRNAVILHLYTQETTSSLLLRNDSFEEAGYRIMFISGAATQTGPYVNITRFDNRAEGIANNEAFAWPISQGWNYFHVTMSQFGTIDDVTVGSFYAIVNYTSSVAQTGPDSHNHSVCYTITEQQGRSTTDHPAEISRRIFQSASLPCTGNLDNNWFINSIWFEILQTVTNRESEDEYYGNFSAKRVSPTEGAGWVSFPTVGTPAISQEKTSFYLLSNATDFYNQHAAKSGGLDPNVSRQYQIFQNLQGFCSIKKWITYHSVTHEFSGSVINWITSPANIPVTVINTVTKEREALVYTNGHGAFTASVYYSGSNYFGVSLQTGLYRGRTGEYKPS